LSNHLLEIDNDFIHGESCPRFSTIDEASSLIKEYLHKKNRLSYIAEEGKEFVMKKHLSRQQKIAELRNVFV
jgi:hypothetical protein